MTAPAAPTIDSSQNGGRLIVTWHKGPATVTSYKVYTGEYPTAPALTATLDATTDAQATGNFRWTSPLMVGIASVYVTALNAGLEESAASNTRTQTMTSDSDGAGMTLQPGAGIHRRLPDTPRP